MYNYRSYLENLFPCVSLRYLLMTQTIVQKGKKDLNSAIGTLVRQNFLNGGAFRAKGNDEQSCLKKPPFMSLFPLERAAQ